MSRISQTLAATIAEKLTEKKRVQVADSLMEFRKYFTEVYESKIPKPVMELFKKHSEYIQTVSAVYLNEKGFSITKVSLLKALPATSQYSVTINLTDFEAKKGKALFHSWQKAKDNYEALKQECETALINLRTFANIEKSLPEAKQYLPQLGLTVVVDTVQLRKKLK